MKERTLDVRDPVIYVDEYRRLCPALLTAVHGNVTKYKDHDGNDCLSLPCVNLVFVTPESDRTDQYGRQIEHKSSISHMSDQRPPAGSFWVFLDERDAAEAAAKEGLSQTRT